MKMLLLSCVMGVAMLGGAQTAAVPAVSLGEVHDFFHVIPTDKILRVVTDYLAYDREVQELIAYMHSAEFKDLVRAVDAQPEYIQFLNMLEEAGFQAYKYVNVIHTLLGMPGLENPIKATPSPVLSGGFAGLIRDVRVLVDEKAVIKFYEDLLGSNPRFQTLVDKFKGGEFKSVVEKLAMIPEITSLLHKLGVTHDE